MSAWITLIADHDAGPQLKPYYDKVRTPHGTVDNVMRAHSLRPHTMEGHVVLYRSVLHHPDNTLALWFLEAVATYVSLLNRCDYSVTHHGANMRRLTAVDDPQLAEAAWQALQADAPERAFGGRELALLRYARKLTLAVGEMEKADFDALKQAGCDDGEILEVNQVCAYFSYSNRLLNGLGVTTEGDVVGYYQPEP